MNTQLTEIALETKQNVSVGARLQITLFDEEISSRAIHQFNFVPQRVKAAEVTIGANIESSLKNLVSTINTDTPFVFKADVVTGTKIKIGVLNPNLQVVDVGSFDPVLQGPIFNPEIIVVPVVIFNITAVTFLNSVTDACSQVKVRVTTNQPMTSRCINYVCNLVNTSVVEFNVLRGSSTTFNAVRNSTNRTQIIQAPALLNTPEVTITNTPYGATVIVTTGNSSGLELQYSLNGINWQNENVFSGLAVGNYTIYVKDQLGCSKNKSFSVLENNFESKANVLLSKENSFRFKEPNNDYLNDENRFFNQSYSAINYCYVQEFLNTDVITTQFKTNYEFVHVFVTNLRTNQITQVPEIKKTNNIGLKQKLTQAKKYKINNTQFGIYFEAGNIIDYDTNIVLDSYQLNGSLPIWAKLGNYISINGSFYEITSIGFDENVNSEVLIFNGVMSNQIEEATVGCIYNLQDYEVYEFDINFLDFQNTEIQIEIKNSDPNFQNYIWKSEIIRSNELLEKYLEIRYYNSTNTNIVYATGIKHLLRLPFNTIKAIDSDTSENYNSDTNTYLLDSKIYEITEFDFMPFPLELWRKLKIALSMDTVFIDGVGYLKNTEFTKENLGSTNLYKVTAQMIKNGFVFNSNLNSSEIIIENAAVNLPGLLTTNSNEFIEY